MKAKALVETTLEILNAGKALDIDVFNVADLSSISDYMIIASGRSGRQVSALASKVVEAAKQNNVQPLGVEGKNDTGWVLVDLGDIIVHIMQPDTREYFQLEKLWNGKARQQPETHPLTQCRSN